jgi:ribonuclease P protein component
MTDEPLAETRPYRFRHRHRLHGKRDFQRVMEAKLRKPVGPITLCGRLNEFGYSRLGLSVPRRVGKANVRNAIKRRLREAFRYQRHQFPAAYDLVILVKPHKPERPQEYQKMLATGIDRIHREVQRRNRQPAGSTKARK